MTGCDGKKRARPQSPSGWRLQLEESRCKLIIGAIVALAIEIIVGLGTFSFKDQPIKVSRYYSRAALLRIRGNQNAAHHTLSNESRALCKNANRYPAASSQEKHRRVYARLFLFTHPRYLSCYFRRRPYAPFSREIAKLPSVTD